MTEEPGKFTYTLLEREIDIKIPQQSQIAAALKIVEIAKRELVTQSRKPVADRDGSRIMEQVAKLLRIIDMMIEKEEDRDFIEDMMIEGKLDVETLVGLMQVFGAEAKEDAPKPKSRARRAS